MGFFPTSLSSAVDTLRASKCTFPITRQAKLIPKSVTDPKEREELFELLHRKAPYPYRALTSIRAFEEMDRPPPIEEFYSDLTQEECSQEKYQLCLEIYDKFKLENFAGYNRLYQTLDSFLLLDLIHR